MRHNNKSGFTLLEIIIVIIIIGVLASLALPRLFATVEYSRSAEALSAIASFRSSIERCYLVRSGNYDGCTFDSINATNPLDLEDPADGPNAHFTYQVQTFAAGGAGGSHAGYTITATRNALEGGDGTSTVRYVLDPQSTPAISKCGTGKFAAIGTCN